MSCIGTSFKVLHHHYAYRVFNSDEAEPELIALYDVTEPEETIAYRLTLVAYIICLTPAIIEPMISSPSQYPDFHEFFFVEHSYYQKDCLEFVSEFVAGHINTPFRPSYWKREEIVDKLLMVEYFRYHNFRQYFLAPIWIYAIRSPTVKKSLKNRAFDLIFRHTTHPTEFLLVGRATFAILEMESDLIRASSRDDICTKGVLTKIIGTLFMPMDDSRHLDEIVLLNRPSSKTEITECLSNPYYHQDLKFTLAWSFDTWDCALQNGSSILGLDDPRTVAVAHALLVLYRHFGRRFFLEAGAFCWFSTGLLSLSRKLSRNPERYQSLRQFTGLFWKIIHHAHRGPSRKCFAMLVNPEDILADKDKGTVTLATHIGCMNLDKETCPYRRGLEELQLSHTQWPSSMASRLTREKMAFLQDFAATNKFCGGCREVMYCSEGCQRADWPIIAGPAWKLAQIMPVGG